MASWIPPFKVKASFFKIWSLYFALRYFAIYSGDTPNDGYAVYPDGPVYPIMQTHAAALKARG